MHALTAHQKQFVLGHMPVRVRPEWECHQLANGLVLSRCPKLRVTRLQSSDGVGYHLLGIAVLANAAARSVEAMFPTKHSSEIEQWTGFWAGRWLLITPNQCLQDAAGLLGIYYRHVNGQVWISSSPTILGGYLPEVAPAARLPWKIAHEKGMDWIPAPLTTREGVYKLWAMRCIDPRSGAIRSVRFSPAERKSTGDTRELALALKTVMGNWGRLPFNQHLIGLTAGFDTRTVLAATKAADVPFRTYTDVHDALSRADAELPPQLAESIHVHHRFESTYEVASEQVRARQAAIVAHMDRVIFHPVADRCASGAMEYLNDPGVTTAGGHGFEIGRCAQWSRFYRAGLSQKAPTPGQLLRSFFSARPHHLSLWMDAMAMWKRSLGDPIALDLDWRDRFYFEQRVGAWVSTVQRIFDVLDGSFFYPANCLWIAHLLLQYSPQQRHAGYAQRSAIELLAPQLAGFPYNPLPLPAQLAKKFASARLSAQRTLLFSRIPNPFKPNGAKQQAVN